MEAAVLSNISALAGTSIGAISSLGTTWMPASNVRMDRRNCRTASTLDQYRGGSQGAALIAKGKLQRFEPDVAMTRNNER